MEASHTRTSSITCAEILPASSLREVHLRLLSDDVDEIAQGKVHIDHVQPHPGSKSPAMSSTRGSVAVHLDLEIQDALPLGR